jgi:signal transduction histidine kinase
MLALLIGLMALVGQAVSYNISTDVLEATVRQNEIDKVNVAGRRFDSLIGGYARRAQSMAKLLAGHRDVLDALAMPPAARRARLQREFTDAAGFGDIVLLDANDLNGESLYRTHDVQRFGDPTSGWGFEEALSGTSMLVSTLTPEGIVIWAIEPLRVNGSIKGTVAAGVALGRSFLDQLSLELGVKLLLLSREGVSVSEPSAPDGDLDKPALTEAFQTKIPIYRIDASSHQTSAYLPKIIVDDGYVLVAQLDSTRAFVLFEQAKQRSAIFAALALAVSLFMGLLILRMVMAPLIKLRKRAEKSAQELTGEAIHVTGRNEISSVVKVLDTLTERLLQRNRELVLAKAEADAANQAKSQFLSSMSHELRTPMNAILGFGQLLEYDDTLSDDHKDKVREILTGGHHLLDLINEVLDLARIESGHIALSIEAVEVDPVIQECLTLVGTLAEKRHVRLAPCELKGAVVRADRIRLKQVLINLLSNAIKYNHVGGSVRLDVRAAGADRLHIRVTDTGPGIPADRMGELFQPFSRLSAENSNIEGSGIGLTITRRIVELMGGTVDVESEVGVGSTFWIELPCESLPSQSHTGEAGETGPAHAVNSAAWVQQLKAAQQTVLYIDDNPINLRLVAQILGRRPHIHLLTAPTPELGIELALTRHPELILLDINMPGLDGYRVLQLLKADKHLKATPVVALTANALPRDVERGKAAGFTAYLTKPLDIPRFLKTVDICLSP